MALSPTIPTSFVPKQPVRTTPSRPKASGGDLFLVVSFFLLGAAVVGSVGVFLYQQYLSGVIERKEADLVAAEERINFSTVEEFIRMRDRLTAGQQLLDQHVALSQFLTVLEGATLANVRFSSMTFTLAEDGTPAVQMSGIARSFNALAAQSNALGADTRIKSAIFSAITVNANNSVSFELTANLSPVLITMMDPGEAPAPAAPVLPVATSTSTTTPSAPVATTTLPVATTTSPVGL